MGYTIIREQLNLHFFIRGGRPLDNVPSGGAQLRGYASLSTQQNEKLSLSGVYEKRPSPQRPVGEERNYAVFVCSYASSTHKKRKDKKSFLESVKTPPSHPTPFELWSFYILHSKEKEEPSSQE